MDTTFNTTTTTTTTTITTEEVPQSLPNASKIYMMNDQKDLFQLCSRHPLSITFLFLFLFPLYLFIQFIVSFGTFISRFIALNQQERFGYFKNLFVGGTAIIGDAFTRDNSQLIMHRRNHQEEDDEDDDMQQWLERCSICFESKLDLCLDYCRDQFCLDCFQKYVTESVKSSWGLSVTKIRCPVCRVYIPQSEWTKFVPPTIVELYNKFNRPYRSFSRSCPHCETEVTPCDSASFCEGRSKLIANMIQEFFCKANSNCTLEQRFEQLLPAPSYQQHLIKLFAKAEWRNSTLPDVHHQLVTKLIKANGIIDQSNLVKMISREILQLDMRPDTWRRLQFDHISFFSNIDCPNCEKSFCLKCGHDDTHGDLTCEENMKRLIIQQQQHETTTNNNDLVQTLKWKLENSRNCPSCSIMINRDEGCNKVDCTLCGFSFCWECKSTWSDGCGFFNCLLKSKTSDLVAQVEEELLDEGWFPTETPGLNGSGSNNNRTELGVPNIEVIHSRLNNN